MYIYINIFINKINVVNTLCYIIGEIIKNRISEDNYVLSNKTFVK